MKKPPFDWEALWTLALGVMVFAILAVTPAWAEGRFVEPTDPERVCVNYISFLTVARTSNDKEMIGIVLDAIEEMGLLKPAIDALTYIDEGRNASIVYPVTYKVCMAKYGDDVA